MSKKFDAVVGNPPYGKNANLAIRFLNKAGEISDIVAFVMPKTIQKPSAQNRVNRSMHIEYEQENDDSTFGGGIITISQIWKVKKHERKIIETKKVHPDFEFTNEKDADVIVGRVGAGPCGRVYTDGFESRSPNSHYFIKANNEKVINRLKEVSDKLREAGNSTVGCPSLSKHQLIEIYNSG